MPSSKGKPTDPKLREEIKKKIKNQPNSDGGGKGQWSAWKAAKLSKEYEKQGGGYENDPGSKNEPKKGTPEPKNEAKKEREVNQEEKEGDGDQEKKKGDSNQEDTEDSKPKANIGKKASNGTAKKASPGTKQKKTPREGTRRSSRVSAKRAAEDAGSGNSSRPPKKKKST